LKDSKETGKKKGGSSEEDNRARRKKKGAGAKGGGKAAGATPLVESGNIMFTLSKNVGDSP